MFLLLLMIFIGLLLTAIAIFILKKESALKIAASYEFTSEDFQFRPKYII